MAAMLTFWKQCSNTLKKNSFLFLSFSFLVIWASIIVLYGPYDLMWYFKFLLFSVCIASANVGKWKGSKEKTNARRRDQHP